MESMTLDTSPKVDVIDVLFLCYDVTRIRKKWMNQYPFLSIYDECIAKLSVFEIQNLGH